jgi:hypothetical protein
VSTHVVYNTVGRHRLRTFCRADSNSRDTDAASDRDVGPAVRKALKTEVGSEIGPSSNPRIIWGRLLKVVLYTNVPLTAPTDRGEIPFSYALSMCDGPIESVAQFKQ